MVCTYIQGCATCLYPPSQPPSPLQTKIASTPRANFSIDQKKQGCYTFWDELSVGSFQLKNGLPKGRPALLRLQLFVGSWTRQSRNFVKSLPTHYLALLV